MSRNSRYLFCAIALLLSAALTVSVQAEKGGKGKPGGGDPPPPPPLPPVEYQVTHISPPYPTDSTVYANDLNDSGEAVGWYLNLAGEKRAWLYDAFDPMNPFSAVDLNDLPIIGLEGWVIHSAVGINNNGLVVGYASPTGDPNDRQGVVIDLVFMEIFQLPDTGWGWADTYARKVNDNGDILGSFRRADGTYGGYLYNPGFRSGAADDDLEIIDVVARRDNSFELNNPMPGFPTQIVAATADRSIMEYTRGGTVSYRTNLLGDFDRLHINDYGDIAGDGTERVQVRKNRFQTVNYIYRDTGIEEYIETDPISPWQTFGITNDGTVLLQGGGGLQLYVDGWGIIAIESLLASGDVVIGDGQSSINNAGLPGFGEIVKGYQSGIQILTPVLITP